MWDDTEPRRCRGGNDDGDGAGDGRDDTEDDRRDDRRDPRRDERKRRPPTVAPAEVRVPVPPSPPRSPFRSPFLLSGVLPAPFDPAPFEARSSRLRRAAGGFVASVTSLRAAGSTRCIKARARLSQHVATNNASPPSATSVMRRASRKLSSALYVSPSSRRAWPMKLRVRATSRCSSPIHCADPTQTQTQHTCQCTAAVRIEVAQRRAYPTLDIKTTLQQWHSVFVHPTLLKRQSQIRQTTSNLQHRDAAL